MCVHIHVSLYICVCIYTHTHLKDIQVFVFWKQTKNQPHKKEIDVNRKQMWYLLIGQKNCFLSQQLNILVIFIIS